MRYPLIDALRGLAMLWMTVFHFCFDLNLLGWTRQAFLSDPFWTLQRSAILGLFLWCAGLSQAVALQGQRANGAGSVYGLRFWGRWGQIAACAVLVSVASGWMFGTQFIYFGVLHGLACMLLLARPLAACGPAWLAAAGGACLALAALAPEAHARWPALQVFNTPGLNVLGFISIKPVTQDYVPLLPWLGVLLAGLACGQWLLQRRPHWLALDARPLRALAGPGRWSLPYYMLHQPVLLATLLLVQALTRH